MPMICLFIVLLALGGVLFLWAKPRIRAMKAQDDAFTRRYQQRSQEIAALSIEEARRQAELLLADPQTFECVLASPRTTSPDILAPCLQSLFSRFESIQAVAGESVLDRALISPFGWDWGEGPWRKHRFWQIGTSSEHAVILVKPYQEGIYDTDGLDDDLDEPDYESVYHWLLMVATGFSARSPDQADSEGS